MGRGDRRTKRGKIFKQSYGKHRPAKSQKPEYVAKPTIAGEIIEKAILAKAEATAIIKEKKVVAEKVEKKATTEKKPKVAKLEELTPDILIEDTPIVTETVKEVPATKKPTIKKETPAKKEVPVKKEATASAPKTAKPKATASKEKPATKKVK